MKLSSLTCLARRAALSGFCAATAIAHAGVSLNGASLNGTSFNGLSLNGANLNGMSAAGLVLDLETARARPVRGAAHVQNMPAATADEASGIALTGARIRIHKVRG